MNTILIVDDSTTIRRMVMTSLKDLSDVRFTEAASGLQGIEALALAPVSLIVLDLNMPDMHGLDVLRFVRSHDSYKEIPVMILTTRGDAASRDEAARAGASAYMTKPFSPSAIAARAAELLASRDARAVSRNP
jgi:two-component system chemotaxis response regulator CheY